MLVNLRIVKKLLFFSSFVISSLLYAQDKSISENSTLSGILDRGELRVCFDATYAPFELISKKGGLRNRTLRAGDQRRGGQVANFVGFDIDLARSIAKELGVKFVPINTNWSSIFPALQIGRCDVIISGMTITEKRAERVDFSNPYFSAGQTILLADKHKDSISSHLDLNSSDYTVASHPDTTGEQAIFELIPNANYVPFDDEDLAINAVKSGELDAFIYDLPFNSTYIALNGNDGLVHLDEAFTDESFGIAMRKNDPDFLTWLNNVLNKLKEDGTYEKIYDKWIVGSDWFSHLK